MKRQKDCRACAQRSALRSGSGYWLRLGFDRALARQENPGSGKLQVKAQNSLPLQVQLIYLL